MVECLRAEGVPVVFGYPGATIAPFYDQLAGSEIRHILTRSEQGAGHAASGWARMTGRPGVCVATSGPGATNLFTALATAYSDSVPMVAITGQVPTDQLGRDVFQEVDTTGAAEPFTKYTYLVKSVEEIGRVFREAFHIASTGRKGPVLIDMPVDVQRQLVDFTYPENVSIRGYKPRIQGHALQVKKVADAICAAKRPLLCCGGGVLLSEGAQEGVRRLCDEASLPLVHTMMGIGTLPPDHPMNYGMLGQAGVRTANTAVEESDLLVLIGVRVGDRAISRPDYLENSATIVHIDIDTAEIGKNMGTTIPLVGDAGHVLRQLLERSPRGDWPEWTLRLDALRSTEREAASVPPPGELVHPGSFMRALSARLPEDAVYVSDVGQNQLWSARNYGGRGRFLTTGGMGTMGYSIPAAIGAKLAEPGRTVVAVCGDGAFQMCMNELATMRQHSAPIKIVVMRNSVLGLVREIQERSYGGREFAVELSGSPEIGQIAAAYGIEHECTATTAAAIEALDRLIADGSSRMLECVVNPKEASV